MSEILDLIIDPVLYAIVCLSLAVTAFVLLLFWRP
jgi:hypothetical protein